jgi:hypothetical protein
VTSIRRYGDLKSDLLGQHPLVAAPLTARYPTQRARLIAHKIKAGDCPSDCFFGGKKQALVEIDAWV